MPLSADFDNFAKINKVIKALIFDWGDTIMRDFKLDGSMWQWEKVAWIDGAQNSMELLSKKYICVIATSASHSNTSDMKLALQRVGANVYFHHFFSQKELGYQKPDVRFFEEILRQLNFSATECVMIGNSYEMDIVGAKLTGMTTILFNENNTINPFESADYVITNMNELTNILLQ